MTILSNARIRIHWRKIGLYGLLLAVLAGLLWFDMGQRGAVWHFIWARTGEEEPIAQIRGIVEWLGNAIRQPLNLAPHVPIAHKTDVPYGINTFLQKEVEEPKMRVQLQMIKDAGFVWLRQEFPWEDLEVDGRGQFTDSRNDYTGDGIPDTINAWDKYDRIVSLTEEYDLKLIVRLSNPPNWARAHTPDTLAGSLGPPDDFQDFVNYAVAVAERYKGRIHHYQVWNEPNIYPEWGENFADPAAYTRLLCMTYEALKTVDPNIVVLSGALAPTISLDGFYGYSDIIYLQNMYDNGAGSCFDVMSVQGYGLFSGPTDQRLRVTNVNFARNLYIRDVMVQNGDSHKPIWISEAAWNPVLDAQLPPEQIVQYSNYGVVTEAQAARYMPIAYQRAQEEWPWVGVINYWFFTRPDDSEKGQAFYYFRMVEPDYQPDRPTFTPLPVYHAVRDYIANQKPILYSGVHQAETWQVSATQGAQVAAHGAQFGIALATAEARVTARGTHISVRWRPDETRPWQTTRLAESWDAQDHIIVFRPTGEAPQIDAFIVLDYSAQHRTPIWGVGLALVAFVIYTLGIAVRRRLSQ